MGCGGPRDPEAVLREQGARLYAQSLCVQCHGPAGEGTAQGPALRDLREHWDETELAKFLANPPAYMYGSPRLRALSVQYGEIMPPLPLAEASLELLAAYLLQEHGGPEGETREGVE